MNATNDAGRCWLERLCQLGAWSRELRQQASGCDAALEELPSASSQAEFVFTGTRELLELAADQVDQTAEALRMVVELLDHVAEWPI
jgi:hypothetical protein